MHFGLPVPLRCTLERKGVGAKRICYLENGFIQETITEWSPPYSMQLTIDRTNMPGRHWLGFEKGRVRPSSRWKRDPADSDYDYHVASLSRVLVLALFRKAGSVLGA